MRFCELSSPISSYRAIPYRVVVKRNIAPNINFDGVFIVVGYFFRSFFLLFAESYFVNAL